MLGNLDVIHAANVVARDDLENVTILVRGEDTFGLNGGFPGLDKSLGGGDCNYHILPRWLGGSVRLRY